MERIARMPTNESGISNLFVEINGEMIPCGDIEIFEVGIEINSQWQLVPMKKMFCNNWRKMHGLPLIRRRGRNVKHNEKENSQNV